MAKRSLSVDEIAAHLGVNADTIYKWITRDRLPRTSSVWKLLASEFDEWIKRGHAGQHATPPSPQSKLTRTKS